MKIFKDFLKEKFKKGDLFVWSPYFGKVKGIYLSHKQKKGMLLVEIFILNTISDDPKDKIYFMYYSKFKNKFYTFRFSDNFFHPFKILK